MNDLYFNPTHDAFNPRIFWSLSNALTSAFKELDPITQALIYAGVTVSFAFDVSGIVILNVRRRPYQRRGRILATKFDSRTALVRSSVWTRAKFTPQRLSEDREQSPQLVFGMRYASLNKAALRADPPLQRYFHESCTQLAIKWPILATIHRPGCNVAQSNDYVANKSWISKRNISGKVQNSGFANSKAGADAMIRGTFFAMMPRYSVCSAGVNLCN